MTSTGWILAAHGRSTIARRSRRRAAGHRPSSSLGDGRQPTALAMARHRAGRRSSALGSPRRSARAADCVALGAIAAARSRSPTAPSSSWIRPRLRSGRRSTPTVSGDRRLARPHRRPACVLLAPSAATTTASIGRIAGAWLHSPAPSPSVCGDPRRDIAIVDGPRSARRIHRGVGDRCPPARPSSATTAPLLVSAPIGPTLPSLTLAEDDLGVVARRLGDRAAEGALGLRGGRAGSGGA